MPFDLKTFDKTFGYEDNKNPLFMACDFQEVPQSEDDEFVVYRAVIATAQANPNYLNLDEDTLKNIATASNRETFGKDIPVFPNHMKYDFQIGNMLTGEYQSAQKRVVGTFNVSKDDETEVLRRRVNNGTIRGISPSVRGPVQCDYCNEKMYRYGACVNGHYLGETIVGENGKEVLIEGTFKDAELVEVSIVGMQAFPDAKIFSDNSELLQEAFQADHIDEKVIDVISQSFAVDIDLKPKKTEQTSQTEGGDPMPAPTDSANVKLLQDQVTDLTTQVEAKDQQIADFTQKVKELEETTVSAEDHQKVQDQLNTANGKIVEKDTQLRQFNTLKDESDAGIAHVKTMCISYYAKIRGVEVDCTTDALFTSRKKSIEDATDLVYLLGSLEQYVSDFCSKNTEFGGNFKAPSNPDIPNNYTPLSGVS